ncbi:potassium efflux system protein [Cricetibacter osteomyelitidis]|uniref:Potassium efflux system protein n=1 Tax=Cricetibacter osteomyelitidis TaxID=1521931 RepID=A0A4R2T3X7_9PAST|nr:mechanosensitive channel MscK [Cricetibacter osteomyelitidis]TCP97669.1 potassium efflux system protein [Cricetibacter osteomyelitidis]
MNKIFRYFLIALFCVGFMNFVFAADIPTAVDISAQLETAKKDKTNSADSKALVQDLEDTLTLLSQIDQQKQQNDQLGTAISQAAKLMKNAQNQAAKLKNSTAQNSDFSKVSVDKLQSQLSAVQSDLQQVQTELMTINANLVTQNTAPDRAQTALMQNVRRTQEINKLLLTPMPEAQKNKLNTELELIGLQNTYNQLLLSGNAALTALYEAQQDEKQLEEQLLQAQAQRLQTAINEKLLQESKEQAVQTTAQSQKQSSENSPLAKEQEGNARLSQELVTQTATLNELSQDNLRIKNVLDNLQQTQRTIDEQISALQGSLVLSRIINKQRQSLPQDEIISGLPKRIADLRVSIFDLTELRDTVFNDDSYISNFQKNNQVTLNDKERSQLTDILQERRKLISDLITLLNSQLNLAINIELNQQQITTISDELQNKLEQQSFWVKSNEPIDLKWLQNFPRTAAWQLQFIKQKLDFHNWQDNLTSAIIQIGLLLLAAGVILRKKERIKSRLAMINGEINTLIADTQWHTPRAIFWTLILCLPSTAFFLTLFILVTYICFQDPTTAWNWGLKMAVYWLFFVFTLALLRPHGLAIRHFNMPPENAAIFRRDLKHSAWWIALFLNLSLFSDMEIGIKNDVLGQSLTVIALVILLLVTGPRFRKAMAAYQQNINDKAEQSDRFLLQFVRLTFLAAPIILIALVVTGYYYTALTLISHLILTFNVVALWVIAREVVYRSLTVGSRRLAYRRLQEKRKQQAEANSNKENEVKIDPQQDELAISQVKTQMSNIMNLLLWAGLFVLLYWVWSDLVKVAYYLEGVTLWQQSVTTDSGTVMESVTLFNLLVAIVVLLITYLLVRNIAGMLETLIFSRFNFSQGAPYTITTLMTYGIIALGAGLAFGILGISWSKLQWLFAALSVGLGFGLQEIFANFVSGIIILFERPARIGDTITIGEFSGTVSKIRIRATTLVDFERKEVIVPNKAFVTERLINWSLTNSVTRLTIAVGVAYGSDLELTKKLLLQAAAQSPLVLKDPPPVVYFLTFGASTLDHELRVHVGHINDRTVTIDFLNRRINELFAENNIDIAFNQLDVFIKNPATGDEVKIVEEKQPLIA